MGKADLHLHTNPSDGMASVESLLAYVQNETDLDVIGITDHEDVRGGLLAQELAAKHNYRFEVVPGAEITTRQGHLLALFIEQTPKIFQTLEQTIESIHKQEGLAIAPHPLSWLTRSLGKKSIDGIMRRGEDGIMLDGIETANASIAGQITAKKVRFLNEKFWKLPELGASDGHHLVQVGSGWTSFEGTTSQSLKEALKLKKTSAHEGRNPSLKEIGYSQIALGLLWGFSATPRQVVRRIRGENIQ